MAWSCHYATGCFVAFFGDISILKSGWNLKKLFCCPALELFHCLPPVFVVYPCENNEATWKKAKKCNKLSLWTPPYAKKHFAGHMWKLIAFQLETNLWFKEFFRSINTPLFDEILIHLKRYTNFYCQVKCSNFHQNKWMKKTYPWKVK